MSFNTDWDVEQYRHPWDSDDQWEVRRQFMLAHKYDIPEAKLVCLAQLYANIEFLQCSYPAKVMEQVKALSAGLDDTLLEKRRQKQTIDFVKGGEDKCKTQVAEKQLQSDHDNNPAKRTRWEIPADSNRPQNRPTASSYFESNISSKCPDDPLPTINPKPEPQSQYHVQQSYYTSTYYNRPQNPPSSDFVPDSSRGPGAHHNYHPDGADNSYSSSRLSNSNTKSSQNLVSRTTTISGKTPANDGNNTDQEKRIQRLVELVSDPLRVGNLGIPFLHNMANKAKLRIRYDWQETPRVKKKNPMFKCLVYIDNVLVVTSDPVKRKHRAKLIACDLAINTLRNAKIKIVTNSAGQLELITQDPGIDSDNGSGIDHDEVAVPGPLTMLPSSEDLLTMARMQFQNFILIEHADLPTSANPISILHNSAQLNDRNIVFQCVSCPTSTMPNFWRCLVKIHDIGVGEGSGIKRVEARRAAAAAALELLRSVAFTLVVKQTVMPGRSVSKEEFTSGEDDSSANRVDVAISEDNIGNKLLRLMGWSGSGGLGKSGREGIAEPVRATEVRGREGFGLPSNGGVSEQFLRKARNVIGVYISKPAQWDLVFSNEFTKDERAALHKIAMKRRLKSGSRGKGAARYLVISQPVDKMKIIEQIIREGGSNEKYKVIPPSGKPVSSAQNEDLVQPE